MKGFGNWQLRTETRGTLAPPRDLFPKGQRGILLVPPMAGPAAHAVTEPGIRLSFTSSSLHPRLWMPYGATYQTGPLSGCRPEPLPVAAWSVWPHPRCSYSTIACCLPGPIQSVSPEVGHSQWCVFKAPLCTFQYVARV